MTGKREVSQIADRVIDHLNAAAMKKFKHTKTNRALVGARLNDGFTEDDCKAVIDNRVDRWLGGEYDEYLRPSTLFRPGNFEGYLNDRGDRFQPAATPSPAAGERNLSSRAISLRDELMDTSWAE